jgi:multidrug resistance efflux pump
MPTKYNTIKVSNDATKAELTAALDQANAVIEAANAAHAALEAALDQAKAAAADKAPKADGAGRGTHVRISSAHPSGAHWRIGRKWGREAVDVAKADLGADGLAALRADQYIVCVEL